MAENCVYVQPRKIVFKEKKREEICNSRNLKAQQAGVKIYMSA